MTGGDHMVVRKVGATSNLHGGARALSERGAGKGRVRGWGEEEC